MPYGKMSQCHPKIFQRKRQAALVISTLSREAGVDGKDNSWPLNTAFFCIFKLHAESILRISVNLLTT